MARSVGSTVDGRYRITRNLARNEQSELWEAEHVFTKRRLSLWMLKEAFRQDGAQQSCLLAEAELLTKARHPAVAQVLDAGKNGNDDPYVALEMLDGRTLETVLSARGMLHINEAVAVVLAIADALAAAHKRQLLHHGISPTCIFLPSPKSARRPGFEPPAKLLNFGLSAHPLSKSDGSVAAMAYAASERLAGAPMSARADVYGIAAILYECLTGKLPEPGDDEACKPVEELRPDVSAEISEILKGCLCAADTRFENAAVLADLLRNVDPDSKTAPASRMATLSTRPVSRPAPSTAMDPVAPAEVMAEDKEPPAPSTGAALRRAVRASYMTPVRIVRSTGVTIDSRSEDISVGGMMVVGKNVIDKSEKVQVRFALPTKATMVSLTAIACWVGNARDGKGAIGLQFTDPPSEVTEDIGSYVKFFGA